MSRKIFFHAALLLTAAAFVFFCSTSTSPHYNSLGDDSAIFQAVGKIWAEGRLPYVDAFENKGPLIFLIDALGYAISPRIGIMALQIPAMFVAFLMAWRSLEIFLSGKAKFAAAAFMLIHFALYSLDGNRTEEWSLPFLLAATYFFLRGLKENFSARFGLVCGVGFGACLMLRAINALPICCEIFLAAIFLLRDGEIKLLRKIFLNFVFGAAVMILPFVVYFAAHGALYEMFYGTILLNVAYTASRENFLLTHLNEYTAYIVVNFMPLYAMIFFGAVSMIKNFSRVNLSGIFCAATMLALMFKLSPYFGYCALITPLLPLLFVVLKNLPKGVIVIALIYPLLLTNVLAGKLIAANSNFVSEFNRHIVDELRRLEKNIPPDEKNSVMIWGESLCASHWVLVTGILPRCRFFGNVKTFAAVNPNVKREWLDSAEKISPRWIIYSAYMGEFTGKFADDWTKNFRQNRDADVEKILAEHYHLVDEAEIYQNAFRLYRRN